MARHDIDAILRRGQHVLQRQYALIESLQARGAPIGRARDLLERFIETQQLIIAATDSIQAGQVTPAE